MDHPISFARVPLIVRLLIAGIIAVRGTLAAERPSALLRDAIARARSDATIVIPSGGVERSYRLHVPPTLANAAKKPVPLVVAIHGLAMNARMMAAFTGLDQTADKHGFIVAYPNGLGAQFNAGTVAIPGGTGTDDVRFIADLIDDVARRQTVDPLRVYATGMSNGGMMCYRLAEELAPRIAAIASVAGTPAKANPKPTRAVPVLHFHGTEDKIVPYTGPGKEVPGWLRFLSVEQTFATWAKVNGADTTGVPVPMPDAKEDGTSVVRQEAVRPGKKGASVILYTIKGGGHTWPGKPALGMLGRSTEEIDANEIIWAFFRANPLTRGAPNR